MTNFDPVFIRTKHGAVPKTFFFPDHKRTTIDFIVLRAASGRHVRVTHNLPSSFITNIPSSPITMETIIHISFEQTIPPPQDDTLKVTIATYKENTEIAELTKDIDVKIVDQNTWEREVKCSNCKRHYRRLNKLKIWPLNENVGPLNENGEFFVCELCFTDIKFAKYHPVITWNIPVQQESFECSDRNPPVQCRNSNRHEANCFCLSCEEDFCFLCFLESHGEEPFKKHKMINQADKEWAQQKCFVHSTETAVIFCKNENCRDHERFACQICVENTHNDCQCWSASTAMEHRKTEIEITFERLIKLETDFLETNDQLYFLMKRRDADIDAHEKRIKSWQAKQRLMKRRSGDKLKLELLQEANSGKLRREIRPMIENFVKYLKQKVDVNEGYEEIPEALALCNCEPADDTEPYKPLPVDRPGETSSRATTYEWMAYQRRRRRLESE